MKTITKRIEKETSMIRQRKLDFWMTFFYNIFMNGYDLPELNREQKDYVLRKFWAEGKVASFVVEGTRPSKNFEMENVNDYPEGLLAFCPFAPTLYGITDWPIKVNLVPIRGATFIPRGVQVVNQDCVIGYAQRSKRSIMSMIEYYVERIVEIEMTIRTNLFTLKAPWLITTTPENETKVKRLFERIFNDELVLYLSPDEIDAIKSIATPTPYVLDKLYQNFQSIINEALTFLGFDNVGGIEKQEHLNKDEVNANNTLINICGDSIYDCMKEFCETTTKVLGHKLTCVKKYDAVMSETQKAKGGNKTKKENEQNE